MTWGGIGASGQFKTINHDGSGTARVDYEEARGDVSGLIDNLLVIGLQGRPVSPLAPVSGYVLTWNGAIWEPTNVMVSISGSLTHNLLSATHPDTVPASPAAGDIIAGTSGVPPRWERFGIGQPGQSLSVGASGGLVWRDPNIVEPIIVTTGDFAAPNSNSRIIVAKPSGSPTAIYLPSTPALGQEILVKDGAGDANSNFITVFPPSGITIDSFSRVRLTQRYQSFSFMWNGLEWNVI